MALVRLISVAATIALAILFGAALGLFPSRISGTAMTRVRRRFSNLACRILGIKVVFDGQIPRDRPVMLVANHVSWTDILALGGIMPITFLARHDVADWPALGQLARIYGTLFIERGRLRQIPSINRQMALRLERGETVGLFPEATTGDGTRLKKFSAVHFAAARSLLEMRPELTSVDIAPVVIAYTRRSGLPLGRAGRAAVAWYGDMEFAPHLLDLARGGAVECRIRFLTPIPFDRSSDRKKLARLAGDAIRFEKASLTSGAAESAPAYVLSGSQSV